MLALNSDRVALAATFAIAAVKLATLVGKGINTGPNWIFCLLYAALCFGLYQGLRPIADVVAGKDYIRSWDHGLERIYKSSPIKYTVDLGFAVFGVCCLLYFMFRVWD